jgi:hypothetical protein
MADLWHGCQIAQQWGDPRVLPCTICGHQARRVFVSQWWNGEEWEPWMFVWMHSPLPPGLDHSARVVAP